MATQQPYLLFSNWLITCVGGHTSDAEVLIIASSWGIFWCAIGCDTPQCGSHPLRHAESALQLHPSGVRTVACGRQPAMQNDVHTPIAYALSLATACSSPVISADVEQQFTELSAKGLSGVEIHPLVTLTLHRVSVCSGILIQPLRHWATLPSGTAYSFGNGVKNWGAM